MASQPFEVCSVTLLFRESDEVFLKQSHRLVHSSRINPLFLCLFKLTVIPCSCHIAFPERDAAPPPPQSREANVWSEMTMPPNSTFSSVAAAGGRMHTKKIKIGEQQTQIWSAGARNASVLPLCTAMGETQIASSNGPVTVNPTLCAHVELKLLKL